MYYNVPTVIANAGFTENLSNIIPTFEEPIVIATWALVFITAIYATITLYMLLIMKRDRERKVIAEIVKNFLTQTINTLKKDKKRFKEIGNSSFPTFLYLHFCIDNRFLRGAIFDRFAKRKPLLKRQILKYNELCSKIHEKIGELKKIALDKGVIDDSSITIAGEGGPRTVIKDKYENDDLPKILKEKGLEQKIRDIKISIEEFCLEKKANKLIGKLDRIKRKLQDKYNLTDEELGG